MWRKIEDRALAYELMQAGLLWWNYYGEWVHFDERSAAAWTKPGMWWKWMSEMSGPDETFILLEE